MRPPVAPALTTEVPRRRPWVGIVTSILIHGTLISLVLWHEARPTFLLRPQGDSVELARQGARQVGMIFLPPPAPSKDDGRSRVKLPVQLPKVEDPPPPPPVVSADQTPPKGDAGAHPPRTMSRPMAVRARRSLSRRGSRPPTPSPNPLGATIPASPSAEGAPAPRSPPPNPPPPGNSHRAYRP